MVKYDTSKDWRGKHPSYCLWSRTINQMLKHNLILTLFLTWKCNHIFHYFVKNSHVELNLPWGLKLKSGGSGRPFGSRVLGSLSSSKKGWMQASNCNIKRMLNPVLAFCSFSLVWNELNLQLCISDSVSTGKIGIQGPLPLEADAFGIPDIGTRYWC